MDGQGRSKGENRVKLLGRSERYLRYAVRLLGRSERYLRFEEVKLLGRSERCLRYEYTEQRETGRTDGRGEGEMTEKA